MRYDDAMSRKTKCWSYSAGEKGRNRVRGFERPGRAGSFMLQYSAPDSTGRAHPHRVALDVSAAGDTRAQRAEVKRRVDELVGKLAETPATSPEPRVTLLGLVERYWREVTPTKVRESRVNDRIALGLAVQAWGGDRDPLTLDRSDWDAYIRRRLAGDLYVEDKRKPSTSRAVRKGTVAAELRLICALFMWATLLRTSRGKPVLTWHPFKGLPKPREVEPAQPRVTDEEYHALLKVAPNVHPQCALALTMAYETGHRLSAIRNLQWRDIDFAAKTVHWRAETDKVRYDHTNPLTDEALASLIAERNRQAVIGNSPAPIFAQRANDQKPICKSVFRTWLQACARLAKLEPVKRRGWHAFRRRFADDLKPLPLKDAAALGGWKSPQMLLTIYQSTSVESKRAALAQRRRGAESAIETPVGAER
jgi:integrase